MNQTEIFKNMTKGEWYYGDSYKNFGKPSAGQWVQMDLYSQLTPKKHDTTSIGKLSFTAKGYDEFEKCESMMKGICLSVNNTYGKGINPESVSKMKRALECCKVYMEDLDKENFTDASAGIFQDKDLTNAVLLLQEALTAAALK